MIFNQIEFLILLVVVLLGRFFLRSNRTWKLLLLFASYYFYAYWDVRFTALLLFSTVVDYLVGLKIADSTSDVVRKRLLLISLVANLGLLGFFKYFNFFIDSAAVLLEPMGIHTGTLNIILPVGISFYTFQTLSYTLDIYRGQLKPSRNFLDFALFVAFFPQLVAGPIVRAIDFLPQLNEKKPLTSSHVFLGFRQFVFGLFKKVFIADKLAVFIDYAFDHAGIMSGGTLWIAVIAYAIQIYCDFSGYSDMAIGTARILGYEFIPNFRLPYMARNITDFWRRWHISLSGWLRDYLYISLGGNRHGQIRTYVNLMLTMVLGGLWHGASWSFVFWGGLHGVALALHKIWLNRRDPSAEIKTTWLGAWLGWVLTMLVVLVSWVFFRANDFGLAGMMLQRMFTLSPGVVYFHPFALFAIGLMAAQHLVVAAGWGDRLELKENRWWTPVVLFTMIGLVVLYYPTGFKPFIYFQF